MTQLDRRPTISLQEPPYLFTEVNNRCPLTHQFSPKKAAGGPLRSWNPSPVQSSMSAHRQVMFEMTSPKRGTKYNAQTEISTQRQSLPPLSSLFNGAVQGCKVGASDWLNPPSSGFSSHSPDYRNSWGSLDQDRFLSSLHVQRRSPSRPLLLNLPRRKSTERSDLPPPPQPPHPAIPSNPGESPRYNLQPGQSEAQRYQTAPSSNERWSPHHSRVNLSTYGGRIVPTSSRDQFEQARNFNQRHIQEIEKSNYLKSSQSSLILPSHPHMSTIHSDSPATKDGLGPKIWTGTHFLPRFVRQAEVPGEGTCYFYDDGTHCKTVIDGEVVNAHWGVTKAGKPRKRLAIACITCREKKIKCDPDYPRCLQCEKFGRNCKFKNAPRGGNSSPGTPPADVDEFLSRPSSSRDEESLREKQENILPVSPSQTVRNQSPDSELHHAKRQRMTLGTFSPIMEAIPSQNPLRAVPSPSASVMENSGLDTPDRKYSQRWHTNPYITQPEIVTELVSVFFNFVPEIANYMFLEGPFKRWALSTTEKSQDECAILNAVLCLASVFSSKHEQKEQGKNYATTCRRIFENRAFSLQLVQSRLLLALYYLAKNQSELAWDLSGSAMRAAAALKLNLEMEKSNDAFRKTFPYGLSREGYAECRRRTFWSTYLVDNLYEFCAGELSRFRSEDIFLRLPCDENSFESQVEVHNPLLNHTLTRKNPNWTIGCMGYLINITTLWGEVMTNIYRRSQREHSASLTAFTKFYEGATYRMREWNDSLPRCYAVSVENIQRAANDGNLGTLITMHSVYHNTGMKLNRYIPHSALTSAQVAHHVAAANQHAEALLTVIDALHVVRRSSQVPKPDGDLPQPKFSSPYVGYSIVSAVDILSATLPMSTLAKRLASFQSSQDLLSELCIFWQSLMNHQVAVQQRIFELSELLSGKDSNTSQSLVIKSTDNMLRMRGSIEPTLFHQDDCIYK